MFRVGLSRIVATTTLAIAVAWPFATFADSGLTAVGVTSDGILLISAAESDVDLTTGLDTAIVVDNSDSGDTLLAVGPGAIQSDAERTWIDVLGTRIEIDAETIFPRGAIISGDYVAVSGEVNVDGTTLASNVVRLGGRYSAGISTVYLRGEVAELNSSGNVKIGGANIDLSQAYYDSALLDIARLTLVEVIGVESLVPTLETQIIANSASILTGITGSGARGITGSGARGITGSGARGITGSGARGITGSGARGITGSGARGITGSGARGITGSGARGITGSGARGITGSGARGITGSGARGITGSGARGITGSGARGITGSGARGITGSGARGITGSGARGITGSGARGITGSGARGITGSGARGITGSGARGITGSGARGITGSGLH